MCKCKSETERKAEVKAMTHEDRLSYAKKMRAAGMGMVVAGFGVFGGLTGGLWGTMGAGAIGVGFGSASGLMFGSCGPFSASKNALKWDAEFEAGDQQETTV